MWRQEESASLCVAPGHEDNFLEFAYVKNPLEMRP
jgi:hypothetical protein